MLLETAVGTLLLEADVESLLLKADGGMLHCDSVVGILLAMPLLGSLH